ncbi:hypothetical protein BaRGS_00029040 [Batillaria attramentaria]|uniref:Secreted protein n=1 Tax=Batillaria attramentaria TaxID=370345 RepID=A0ABD0JY31_9CAEN
MFSRSHSAVTLLTVSFTAAAIKICYPHIYNHAVKLTLYICYTTGAALKGSRRRKCTHASIGKQHSAASAVHCLYEISSGGSANLTDGLPLNRTEQPGNLADCADKRLFLLIPDLSRTHTHKKRFHAFTASMSRTGRSQA